MQFVEHKPGRNEACWCGSGAKYKKCHLISDEALARERRDLEHEAEALRDPMAEKLFGEVMDGTARWHTRADFDSAGRLYFDAEPAEFKPDAQEEDGFVEWYVRDFRSEKTGLSAIEEYLNESGPRLTERERSLVESWRDGKYSLFEIQRVEPGVGVALKDLLDGAAYFVPDVLMSKQARIWDCLFIRVELFEGRWVFGGNLTIVPRAILRDVRADIAVNGLRSHEMHRRVEELYGDWIADIEIAEMEDESPPEKAVAEYEAADQEKLLGEMRKAEEFVEQSHGRFTWFSGDALAQARIPLGIVTVQDGILQLECDSRVALEIGRDLLDRHAGAYLKHVRDSF